MTTNENETQTPDQELSDSLANNYMLADLSLRNWTAEVSDKALAAETALSKGATSGALKATKNLLAGNDAQLKACRSAYAAIRTWYDANSLPWNANTGGRNRGPRLVGAIQAMTFLRDFNKLKTAAEDAREKFINSYDDAVSKAQQSLGELYDPSKYPSADQLRFLFSADLELDPMPVVTDFDRVAIPGALAQGLKAIAAKRAAKQVDRAVIDCQTRLLAELERLSTQLTKVVKGEPTRLHKTLISNMQTMAGLAESLGPVSPELATVADKVKANILVHEVSDFKDNAALSGAVARHSQEIASHLTKAWVEKGKAYAGTASSPEGTGHIQPWAEQQLAPYQPDSAGGQAVDNEATTESTEPEQLAPAFPMSPEPIVSRETPPITNTDFDTDSVFDL